MADPEHVDTLRDTVAHLLDEMAAATADARFRSAAAMVRGARGGRRGKDDTQALEYARALQAVKAAPSRHRAAEMAAVLFASNDEVEAMRDRIHRKLRT